MSLEAMVGGALRDMTPNDCQYVIVDSISGKFDCGFLPRFIFFSDDSGSLNGSFFVPGEGKFTAYYYSGGQASFNLNIQGTVLDFGSMVSYVKHVIAFK